MSVYAYIVPVDDGAAPNPYGGICTLNLCKPHIRKNAKLGDWLIGIGSKDYFGNNLENHIIFAMEVTKVLSMKDYDSYCKEYLPKKIPNLSSNNIEDHMGDCVYEFINDDVINLRKGVHSRCTKDEDMLGENTLLSSNFYYFGKTAIKLPKRFYNIAKEKLDYSILEENIASYLIDWLNNNNFQANKIYSSPNRIGIISPSDRLNEKSCCIRKKDIRTFL